MKYTYIILSLLFTTIAAKAQSKYLTKQGQVSFFSSTPVEDIKAENNQVLSVLDSNTGTIAISILMKSFYFEKALMQEHFNENYVESDTYPKAIFKGLLPNAKDLENGEHEVTVQGKMTMHGVTQQVEVNAVLIKFDEGVELKGEFPLTIADYQIDIPSAVTNNIAKTVLVSFELNHKPYKK
ncbi:YceI family protein [Wenyingzhuangia sp. IMCC45533]